MTQDLERRWQEAFVELESAYEAMEEAKANTDSLRWWVRRWLDTKDLQAAND